MMPRKLLFGLAIALAIVAAGAGGGYVIMQLRAQQAQTAARLQETQGSLQQQLESLKQLQGEHTTLTESYETLKSRWQSADEERARLERSSAQLLEQLAALHKEEEAFQRQSEEAVKAKEGMTAQVAEMQQHLDAQRVAQRALESELREAKKRTMTEDEANRLAQSLKREQARGEELREEMASLSRAYERLAQAHHRVMEVERADAGLAEPEPAAALPAAPPRPEEAFRDHPQPTAARENPNLAARYRQLAASYFGAYRYADAARLYERSLAYDNDPDAHTQLAMIYSRFLQDPERAAWHAARAGSRDPVRAGLKPLASQRGMPRSDWRLLWRWLTE